MTRPRARPHSHAYGERAGTRGGARSNSGGATTRARASGHRRARWRGRAASTPQPRCSTGMCWRQARSRLHRPRRPEPRRGAVRSTDRHMVLGRLDAILHLPGRAFRHTASEWRGPGRGWADRFVHSGDRDPIQPGSQHVVPGGRDGRSSRLAHIDPARKRESAGGRVRNAICSSITRLNSTTRASRRPERVDGLIKWLISDPDLDGAHDSARHQRRTVFRPVVNQLVKPRRLLHW